jgi:2-keto-4-pentenoate hydratase
VSPRAEAEIAFVIGRDLPADPSVEELVAAIDGVCLAIEVIDSRIADWKITLVDTVADNASSARIVHGDAVPATPELLAALPDLVVSMRRDGQEVTRGTGSAVLGHPVSAALWLAGAIGAFGEAFRAGDVILAGAVDVSVPLTPESTWVVEAPGFSPVTLHVAGSAKGVQA